MSRLPRVLGEGRARDAALVCLAGIGQAAATGMAAFATRDIFSALNGSGSRLLPSLVMLAAAGAIVAGLRIASRTIAERLGQSFIISLRRRLYRHLAGLSRSDLADRRTGALGMRFVGDLTAARGWVSLGLTRIYSACVILPGAALALYLLNPALAAAAAIPIVVALLVMVGLATTLERLHRRLRSKRASIAASMMERIAVVTELDLMGRTEKELAALARDGDSLRGMAVDRMLAVSCLRAVPELGAALAGVALLWTAARTGAGAADAAGALAALGVLILPLRELAGVWDRRCAWLVAREKCNDIFAKPSCARVRRRRGGAPAITLERIVFRGVRGTAEIRPGETVLVSGRAGSGKSSLLALAAGLETPDAGRVRFGGSGDSPKTVFIGQGSPILRGSLRRALTLGISPRPSDHVVEAMARRFGLAMVIDRLGGLDGRVGEGGRTLSGGEKVRVHLVRAALTAPDLLVIDTPEIGLDPDTAAALGALMSEVDATTLIAACDGSLDRLADRHLRIEGGQLVELPLDRTARAHASAVAAA